MAEAELDQEHCVQEAYYACKSCCYMYTSVKMLQRVVTGVMPILFVMADKESLFWYNITHKLLRLNIVSAATMVHDLPIHPSC